MAIKRMASLPENARIKDYTIEVCEGEEVRLTIELKNNVISILNKAGTTDFGFKRSLKDLEAGKLQTWKDVVSAMQKCIEIIEETQKGNISVNL